ncbi:MAG: metalloregulator ArsR/SmtB family transcription factor [Rhodobacteraceae bacterium]|nr:metalloregulator ArsR/SmtB family transcription factor [Paracoccaceae bacterium]
MEQLLMGLRAAAESTRLRILSLCAHVELTVSDLVHVLGQSQPRVSRHLRLLVEAGLLERHQEGNRAWYRLAEARRGAHNAEFARYLVDLIPEDDEIQALDLSRLEEVKAERARVASDYFRANADSWSEIRALHVDPAKVDAALRQVVLQRPVERLLDIGTGTGRVLELVGSEIKSAIGIDLSREMLAVARHNLDKDGLRHCRVRQADMNQLPFANNRFDAVTLHMVLHYSERPAQVLSEAARVLNPGGRVIVVDFAPHSMTVLLDQHSHRWPGFEESVVKCWFSAAGLSPEEPLLLDGDPLTVVIWPAARPANDGVSVAARSAVS